MRVAILADDLIWASRLADLVRGAGAEAVPVRTAAALETALPDVDRVIVDLTSRAYDGTAAIAVAAAHDRPSLAVGQHDDVPSRQAALAAGADLVLPYRALHDDGPRRMTRWLAETPVTGAPA